MHGLSPESQVGLGGTGRPGEPLVAALWVGELALCAGGGRYCCICFPVHGQTSVFVCMKPRCRLMDKLSDDPRRECAPSTWPRRDRTAVCRLPVSDQACIWPCTLFSRRRCISKQLFYFYHSCERQFSEELRGRIGKRTVLSKPVCRGLQLVKSQVRLQSWKAVGSHAGGVLCSGLNVFYLLLVVYKWLPLFIQ